MPVEHKGYMGLVEAAAYLGVSRDKLRLMAKAGEVRYYTDPLDKRFKLFRRDDLDKLRKPTVPRP